MHERYRKSALKIKVIQFSYFIPNGGLKMKNELLETQVEVTAFSVVGFCDDLNPKSVKHLWDQLYDRMNEIQGIVNTKIGYGVIQGGKYIASVQVSDVSAIPEGMKTITLPENEYVIFTHIGPIYNLMSTWNL